MRLSVNPVAWPSSSLPRMNNTGISRDRLRVLILSIDYVFVFISSSSPRAARRPFEIPAVEGVNAEQRRQAKRPEPPARIRAIVPVDEGLHRAIPVQVTAQFVVHRREGIRHRLVGDMQTSGDPGDEAKPLGGDSE